uniref:Ubiquitin-conjugating enzyme E2 U-like n=1 Tax=Phallusia mammillata TaxID=59560 RepID=A0A6F9DX61_9ASCI|nr:ubiquitin-conjugating enzyme E2 U-like [Phallusia mammillata]
MHCRSVLLLEREFQQLRVEPLWGITIHQIPNNPLLYLVVLSGLKGSAWEHGKFHITLNFSEHFDEDPPEITFNTIPFHPNVNPESGKLCINTFTKGIRKNEHWSIANILLNVQYLLSNPVLENPVNTDASEMLYNSPSEYEKTVEQCAAESVNVQEILHSQFLENFGASFLTKAKDQVETFHKADVSPAQQLSAAKAKQISFDVYHQTWAQVATTKPESRYSTEEEHIPLQMWNPDYAEMRSVSPGSVIRIRTKSPTNSHVPKPKMNHLRQKKMERISAMKQLYMNRSTENQSLGTAAPVTSMTDIGPAADAGTATASSEPWDHEADELVAWAGKLNEEAV